ncbi:tetratricopeptide repeat protein 21B-like isoform X2 [Fundulus heteroclitus]|uniref:tetratricopeptide repeat protein 21B-like isoform X2 n=1 Tax=Fundulus heteroclitus TaxID=8078 RepID=UPI00165C0A52|nr:tetratricopeptide repeat protein 21B-like isoform X2 [Fundulus heteroclitus]
MVKERPGAAFGQRQLMDRFRASLTARARAPGESLEVYAADVSRLVAEAFPDYGDVAQREEKFRRFLAGLDPALKAKCLEMGATDLEEALHVAERCENARAALQRDYALIKYYCYEKQFNHAVNSASAAQRKFSHDPVYVFFHAYATLMQGEIQEATAELDTIRDDRDLSLCTLMALVYAEKKKANPDKDIIQQLDAKVKEDRKSAPPKSLYHAGTFLWLLGRNDRAREYTERMIKLSNGSREGIILKAWIDVTSEKDAYVRKAGKYFDEGLKERVDVFALMGKILLFP